MSATVFLDTNVFIDALEHASALRLLVAAEAGTLAARSSVTVVEELWHLELSGRVPGLEGIAARARDLLAPVLELSHGTLVRAMRLEGGRLGANDRVIAATCFEHLIETIVSADRGFDDLPLLRRVDPRDAGAVEALLEEALTE